MIILGAHVGVVLGTLPAAAQSSAPLTICNKTSEIAGAAVGFFSPGVNKPTDGADILTGPFVSHGWWNIEAGACHTFDNPFNARYMFWFAYTPSYQSTPEDPSKIHFCIPIGSPPKAFTFEEENVSKETCSAAGNTWWITANRVDTWINATVDFTGQ